MCCLLVFAIGARVAVASPGGDVPGPVPALEWQGIFGGAPGTDGPVYAIAEFDDGSGEGPSLFVGGFFQTAGGTACANIARWNGTSWSPVGGGTSSSVIALAVFDDGSGGGPALYAAGQFTQAGGVPAARIARWDGTTWTPVGAGFDGDVYGLTVFDDGFGDGPALYACGVFVNSGGVAVNRVARWSGSNWTSVGSGLNAAVWTLVVFDDGSGNGPELHAGGAFTIPQATPAIGAARWNGDAWIALGSGVNNVVYTLEVHDDGSGAALYAGGLFTTAGGAPASRVARWNGASWSALGPGLNQAVFALRSFDDGNGPALIAGGQFFQSGAVAVSRIARWDGLAWSPMDGGMNDAVRSLATVGGDDGDSTELVAAGLFTSAGVSGASRVARWGQSAWSTVGTGLNSTVWSVAELQTAQDAEPTLYAGGEFVVTEGAAWDGGSTSAVARWNDGAWQPIGGIQGKVFAIAGFDDDDDGVPSLHAGGTLTVDGIELHGIAKWDGANWASLGSGLSGTVGAGVLLAVEGCAGVERGLFVGGPFETAGGLPSLRLALWDGAAWSAVPEGPNNTVFALAAHDDGAGSGQSLYVGGAFTWVGGMTINRIARWDGTSWSTLGSGMNGSVRELIVHDDGSGAGPCLYAGGSFTFAGGVSASRVARWNGVGWSALGAGVNGDVTAMAVVDEGNGVPVLYVGGSFTQAGGLPAERLARWDGTTWSAIDGGPNKAVHSMTALSSGAPDTAALVLGGEFVTSPGGDSFIAKLASPRPAPNPADLNQDGQVDGADLGLLLNATGPCPGCPEDLDGNGIVDGADLGILLASWSA